MRKVLSLLIGLWLRTLIISLPGTIKGWRSMFWVVWMKPWRRSIRQHHLLQKSLTPGIIKRLCLRSLVARKKLSPVRIGLVPLNSTSSQVEVLLLEKSCSGYVYLVVMSEHGALATSEVECDAAPIKWIAD